MHRWWSDRIFENLLNFGQMQNVKRFIFLHLPIGIVFAILWNAQEIYYKVVPTSSYFIYYDVSPAKSQFDIGEDLIFVSDAEFFKSGDYRWRDILRCWDERGVLRFSEYNSWSRIDPKERRTVSWKYWWLKPNKDIECYLESQISVELPYNIIKTQTHIWWPFYLWNPLHVGDSVDS